MSTYIIDYSDPLRPSFTIAPGSFNGPGGSVSSTSLRLYGRGALEWGEAVDEDLVRIAENFAGASAPLYPMAGQLWYKQNLYWRNTSVAVTSGVAAGVNAFSRFNLTSSIWEATDGGGLSPFQVAVTSLTIGAYVAGSAVGNYVWSIADNKLYRWDQAYKQSPLAWMSREFTSTATSPVSGTDYPSQSLRVYDQFAGGVGAFTSPPVADVAGSPPVGPSVGQLWIDSDTGIVSVFDYNFTGIGPSPKWMEIIGPNSTNVVLTGVPTAPTAAVGTNTTQLATTEFVTSEIFNDALTVVVTANNGPSGPTNSAFGYHALNANISGVSNTALGYTALGLTTAGSYNAAFGTDALHSNLTGNNNTAVGFNALYTHIGTNSTAVGYHAARLNTGSSITAVGASALAASTGNDNTAVGTVALTLNTAGYSNTAVGSTALQNNTTGNLNTAVGSAALVASTIGTDNNAFGSLALTTNTIGNRNVAVGTSAAGSTLSGNNNVALGNGSLFSNVTGNGNVALGYQAGYGETGSNTLYISNTNTATPLIKGVFDPLGGAAGSLTINAPLFATTPTNGTNNTQVATTAYVQSTIVTATTVPVINPVAPKDGDIKVVGSVVSVYAGAAWRQIFPAQWA